MVDAVTTQVTLDGAANYVMKVVGILDTSDVSATGTLGAASSGVTTLGSATVSFTAGGLAPVTGQLVTGTGIPAGTYIVSATTTSAVLSAAATAANTGLTFTLVAGAIVIADPATMCSMLGINGVPPTQFSITRILYTVSDFLQVRLLWDATTPVYIGTFVKAGHQDLRKSQSLINNAGAGKTGRLLLSTTGYSTGTLEFTIELEFVKQHS